MKEIKLDISSNSYIPYSKQPESCYILGSAGILYPGVRVENSSFPLTISAIQAAICSCLGNSDTPVGIISKQLEPELLTSWIDFFHLDVLNKIPENSILYEPLTDDIENKLDHLKHLCTLSHSDQSEFPVASLLKTQKGFIPGVNIEFRDWNLGLCAERVAISRALASGYTDFLEISIYAPKSEFISPCGACRQVLYEFMPDKKVELIHDDESKTMHFISHLLPNRFITQSLKK